MNDDRTTLVALLGAGFAGMVAAPQPALVPP